MSESVDSALAAAENLDLTLETLDEKEFDLPPVVSPPTLESILNEPETESVIDENDLVAPLYQGDQGDSASMSSQESMLDDKPKRKSRKARVDKHGSILRHVIMKGISQQLLSAVDRVNAGMPTAMAVANMIALGTSHGLVLVFDPKQVLKWCLGSTAVGAQFGAVSALSFNRDSTRLLVGHAKGQITMWDLTNGKLLRTITDAHPPGTAILHVKFTDDLTVAVSSDSGGSVFELEFKRLIGVRTCESKCLFSGSRGEVCTIEPLHMNHMVQDHPMKDVLMLAMGTLSKVLVVTIRPNLKVFLSHPLRGSPSTLPLLAWQFVVIQVTQLDRVIDPVLAFARDQTIFFYQVTCNSPEDVKFSQLQRTDVPYKLLNIQWLNSRTLIAIDTTEKAHIIDVRAEEELEVVDLSGVQMVYSTSFYKSLATGGNVSKALAFAGERACYQSITSYNNQLLLLGTKSVHILSIRPWDERLDTLVKQGRHQDALALAVSFYEGKAKAVVGLVGGLQKRRQAVADKMLELLDQYVDVAMTTNRPAVSRAEDLEEYYQDIVPVCVDYCLTLGRMDILFDQIYDQLSSDDIARGVFLECLQPYIVSDQLTAVAPAVMKDFVDHYQQKGMLQDVEACIVHLDITSLDLNQVVVLCWKHALYDAILYIYNKGMRDYVTPLEDLLKQLMAAISTGKQLTDTQIKLGNKLLVYISCCLAGRAYPLGDIPEDLVPTVKENVFVCVTAIHSKDRSADEPVYPYLRSLLQYDTREFLNVLALAFEEPEFNSEEGVQKRQRVVDILLQIMVESVGFTPTQVGILFTFLARQMARHENTILVNRVLFDQVLEFLCCPGDDTRHEERQQALMELLQAGGLQHFEQERLLTLAEGAKFYQVCEMLYYQRREFDKILSCYWRDEARKEQAFSYIERIMISEEYSIPEKQAVQKEATGHLKELVLIDSKKTAQLVLEGFSHSLSDISLLLEDDPATLFKFLSGVFEYRDTTGSAIQLDRQVNIEPVVHEKYINLMCQFDATQVFNFIRTSEGYRLEEALNICRRHNITDATAFLLEKTGDVQGAFSLMLESLQSKINTLVDVLSSTEKTSGDELMVAWTGVHAILLSVIQLCQRNSSKMDEAQREELWFPLLDAVMEPYRHLKDSVDTTQGEALKELTSQVLNSMMGYISLPAILQKIMQDPAYNRGRFGEVKELILGMLDTYNYEKTLLHTCNNLVNHDLHVHLATLTRAASRGIISLDEECGLCNKGLASISDSDSAICFRCGHSFHSSCLKSAGFCSVIDNEETWLCHLCHSSRRGQVTSSTRKQRLPSVGSHGYYQAKSSTGGNQKSNGNKVIIEPEQIQAIDALRRVQKTASRLAILTELAKPDSANRRYRSSSNSILQNEQFQLRLAPRPVFE